jgi:hypothetical protein
MIGNNGSSIDIADCDVIRQLPLRSVSYALPFFSTQAVRTIRIITPVSLDGVRPRAIGICLLGGWPDAITPIGGFSGLTILDRLSPACLLVLNYLGESFFHDGYLMDCYQARNNNYATELVS